MRPIILPEEKLDELAQEVCDRLLRGHFFNNGVVRGEELKNFAEHQQINKFLLFQIYQVWTIQINKLKHPYFDFSHQDVKRELKSLRNLLSQHIHISEKEFQPLLKRAAYNNLKLLLNPESSFEDFFFKEDDSISLELFTQYAPFFTDMDFVVNSILRYHQKHQLQEVQKETFFLKMDKVITLYNEKSEKDFEAYRKELIDRLIQRNIDTIIDDIEREKRLSQQEQEKEVNSFSSYDDEWGSDISTPQTPPQPAQETNFFETANESSVNPFDFSDDMDDSGAEYLPPMEEEPKQRPAARMEDPYETFRSTQTSSQDFYSPSPEREEDRYTSASYEDSTESFQPSYQDPSPFDEASSKPKTVEEALSAFLNKEDREPPQSVYDRYKDQEKPKERPSKPLYDDTLSSSMDRGQKEPTPSHVNRFVNDEKEEVPSSVSNYSRIVNNHKGDRSPTVAERFQTEQKASGIGGKEIKLSDIPIHRQYQFVQKVFEGNNVRFRIIVDKVNNSKDREEVESIIDRFVLSNDNINKGDEVVQEFIQILRSRH